MAIRTGDKVKFLNDVGGGIVTRIDSNGLAHVKTDDDFEVPVSVSELLKMEEDIQQEVNYKSFREERKVYAKEEKKVKTGIEYYKRKGEALLALVPEEDKPVNGANIILYIINDCNYPVHYMVAYSERNANVLLKHGILEADTKLKVKEFSQTEISKIESLKLQCFWFKDGVLDIDNTLNISWNIASFQFYKPNTYGENDYFEENALLMNTEPEEDNLLKNIKTEDIAAAMMEKEIKKEGKKQAGNPEILEVDLHIENIIDEHKHLSNGEIVNIQLDRFETALITAINSTTRRIVFIHGVGNGKLKYELRKILEDKYPDLYYQDASFKEYGYGATMVKIR